MVDENETLRWPTNLDHAAIVRRLVEVRNSAEASGFTELAAGFAGVEGMPRAQIETRVANALKWLGDKPQHQKITATLELVELNLKNLK